MREWTLGHDEIHSSRAYRYLRKPFFSFAARPGLSALLLLELLYTAAGGSCVKHTDVQTFIRDSFNSCRGFVITWVPDHMTQVPSHASVLPNQERLRRRHRWPVGGNSPCSLGWLRIAPVNLRYFFQDRIRACFISVQFKKMKISH